MIVWFIHLTFYLVITNIIFASLLFTLFLVFKPLRKHPGGLLMLGCFFQCSWKYAIIVDHSHISSYLLSF